MIFKRIYNFSLFIFLLIGINAFAQTADMHDSTKYSRVRNVVPRVGIGVSRHFISEVGIAYMRSNFVNHKELGLNTANFIYYASIETMSPYKKPFVLGYKIGTEMIFIGHVTSACVLELAFYQKDSLSSLAFIPKLGLPLMNGSLSYGIVMYFNPEMRKEIGRHRISLTYCFNRKSDIAFSLMPIN